MLTGRFVVLVATFAVVVAVLPVAAWISLVLVALVALALFVADWALTPRPSRLGFERVVPAVIALGGSGVVEWTLANPTGRRLHVAVADEIPPSFRTRHRRAALVLATQGRGTASIDVHPSRRGRFVLGEVVVRVWGPLGLAARQGRRRHESVVRVHPPTGYRREAELRIERARVLEVGLRSARGHGGGTDFEQLREYTVDDDPRHLDWAATARAGKPIVRTYRAERNQNIVVLLDCGRLMAGRVAGVPRFEHALDALLMLTTVAARLGDKVGVIAFDRTVRAEVAARAGAAQTGRVTEAVYALEPALVESDYRRAFVQALSRFRRRSLVVVLTEAADQAIDETLLPALPLVARNHLVVVASVTDPDVAAWARAVPEETNKAYRKASALGAMANRRATLAALRARGATVVDAEPGRLSTRLTDAYLDAKATGRL